MFPDVVHEPIFEWLCDLAASDVSPGTQRSYAYDLLRWLRFLRLSDVAWEHADRGHVRGMVEFLRQAPNPLRQNRSASLPSLGSVNAVTGKPYPVAGYAKRTINHQLTVLHGFYQHAVDTDLGPLLNPVPVQRGRNGSRAFAHQSPLEPAARSPRASYRQRVPKSLPRGIPDEAADRLFSSLRSHRDRALVAFWVSSGARASELLGLRHERIDYGRRTITVITKGTQALDDIPASSDAFVWLALYLAEEADHAQPTGPVWWTLREPRRPLTYHAARAVLVRANTLLGTNYSLHDLRHTAATRMAADENFSLVDIQTILRHASVTTTQLYLQPRIEDLVGKVTELYERRAQTIGTAPVMPAGYDHAELIELLGLPK